jgi:hypothetical protein
MAARPPDLWPCTAARPPGQHDGHDRSTARSPHPPGLAGTGDPSVPRGTPPAGTGRCGGGAPTCCPGCAPCGQRTANAGGADPCGSAAAPVLPGEPLGRRPVRSGGVGRRSRPPDAHGRNLRHELVVRIVRPDDGRAAASRVRGVCCRPGSGRRPRPAPVPVPNLVGECPRPRSVGAVAPPAIGRRTEEPGVGACRRLGAGRAEEVGGTEETAATDGDGEERSCAYRRTDAAWGDLPELRLPQCQGELGSCCWSRTTGWSAPR